MLDQELLFKLETDPQREPHRKSSCTHTQGMLQTPANALSPRSPKDSSTPDLPEPNSE